MCCFHHVRRHKNKHTYTSKYTVVLKKNCVIYKNGSKPTINQGVCRVNSTSNATAHRKRSVFVSLSCSRCIPTFLLTMSYWKQREAVPAGLLVTFTSCSVPTSRSHFLIQLALCSPTVKVKVCELLRGGPLRERVCVCAHKSNENKSAYEEMALPGRR